LARRSTKKVLLVLLALNSGNLAVLTMLGLSASFGSVHHPTSEVEEVIRYMNGVVINCFGSYLDALMIVHNMSVAPD